MKLFSFLSAPDINEGLQNFHQTPNAILLDVRTAEEYQSGNIPHSQNLPLHQISQISNMAEDPDTPLFIYCLSGARSRQAVSLLKQMGYTNVVDLGGINRYNGKVVK
jgi:phage shock protein E